MKNNLKIYLIMLFVSLTMCSGFVFGHYSTDDYNIMNIGYNEYSLNNNLREGRPFMYIIDQIYSRLNINYDAFFISTVIFAIMLTCINIVLLYNLIKKYTKEKDKLIIFIILFSTIFNFMYIENLYYVESIVMSLSLVLYTISAKNYFDDKKHHITKAMIYALLATLCYNGIECYYISIIAFLSLLKNKSNYKQIIIDILKAGMIIIISVIINYIQMILSCKFFNMSKTKALNNEGFIINMFYLIYYSVPKTLISSSYLFPKYLFIIIVLLLIIVSLIIEKLKNKKGLSFQVLLLLLVCISSCYCIGIMSVESFGTGRLLFGIGMSIGIVLLYLFINNKNDKKIKNIIIIISIIWTIINIVNYCYRTNYSQYLNKVEKEKVIELNNKIKKYEKNNNKAVNEIVFVFPAVRKQVNDIDASALQTEWSSIAIIKYYTNRDIKQRQINSKQNDYYLNLLGDKEYIIYENKIIIKIYNWILS